MAKVEVIGKVDNYIRGEDTEIHFEFGRTQMEMQISANGTLARKLTPKAGQKFKITIEEV